MKLISFLTAFASAAVTAVAVAVPQTIETLSPAIPEGIPTNFTASGDVTANSYKHGRCSFHAQQHQFCDVGQLRSRLRINSIMDDDHRHLVSPRPPVERASEEEWKDLTWKDTNNWVITLPKGFSSLAVTHKTKPDRHIWSTDTCKWDDSKDHWPQKHCGDCWVGGWKWLHTDPSWEGPVDCRYQHWKTERFRDMDCSFAC